MSVLGPRFNKQCILLTLCLQVIFEYYWQWPQSWLEAHHLRTMLGLILSTMSQTSTFRQTTNEVVWASFYWTILWVWSMVAIAIWKLRYPHKKGDVLSNCPDLQQKNILTMTKMWLLSTWRLIYKWHPLCCASKFQWHACSPFHNHRDCALSIAVIRNITCTV